MLFITNLVKWVAHVAFPYARYKQPKQIRCNQMQMNLCEVVFTANWASLRHRLSLLLWATCDLCFYDYLWSLCSISPVELLGIIHTDLDQHEDELFLWHKKGGLVNTLWHSVIHLHSGFPCEQKSQFYISKKCRKWSGAKRERLHWGAGWDPTQLCSRVSPSSLTHKHNTRLSCFIIPTGHINSYTHMPASASVLLYISTSSLLQLQSSRCLALNTLFTCATWLTLTLIISPLELPVFCWNGWLFVTLTAPGLVSIQQASERKLNEKTWIYRSGHPLGLASQWQFNTPFVMKSCSQLWSLCLIVINLVGMDCD